MIDTPIAVDWCELMSSWDRQQEGYLPAREERFRVMFEAIEVLVGEKFLALDLACGPGSISQRLLKRFPSARRRRGRPRPGAARDRTADAGNHRWPAALGRARPARHGLERWTLAAHVRRRPLDDRAALADAAAADRRVPPTRDDRASGRDRAQRRPHALRLLTAVAGARHTCARAAPGERAFEHEGAEDWQRWWTRLDQIPALADLLAERKRRFGGAGRDDSAALWGRGSADAHCSSRSFACAALSEAGFVEIGSIWQELDDYILLAVR